MFDEIISSTRTTLAERLSSPLMGSFVISWCLWNYKFLVILFSAASVTKTFELIDSLVFPDLTSLLLQGILFPGLTAAAYIFIYPYPARIVFEFTRKRQKDMNEIRRRIADETLLTLDESRKIRSEFVRIENEYKEEIDSKTQEIERLKDVVLALQHPPEEAVKSDSLPEKSIEDSQLELLKYLASNGGEASHEEVIRESAESKVKTEYDLGELERQGLIQTGSTTYGLEVYKFTHEGRRYLLKHDQDIPF